ncbi:MAG: hypothetical protein Q4F29_04365 [Lachnospiraceae bacterium]|nr:hypothetical protein [Lachnospiraceae bacterium]
MGFLIAFFGSIILLVLFVVAVTVSTVSSCLGAIADDLNEDKG